MKYEGVMPRSFRWRLKIGFWFIRLGTWIAGIGFRGDGLEPVKE